jgi:thiol-disulfide isomerase/thioredoxin
MRFRSSLIRNLLWGVAAVALVLVAYGYRTGVRIRPADKAPVAEGLVLVDTLGAPVDLGSMSGRIVVVNLWASWCGYCRMEIPSLNDLSRKYREQGVIVLGVNLEEGGNEELLARVRDLEIDYPVVRPAAPLTGPFADGSALPHTWIVDRRSRVRASHSGYASGRSLEKAVEKLLREN